MVLIFDGRGREMVVALNISSRSSQVCNAPMR